MTTRSSVLAASIFIALVACEGGQTGEVAARPCVYSDSAQTPDGPTPLGASALELVEGIEPGAPSRMTWGDDVDSELTVTLEYVEGYGELMWRALQDGPEYCEGDHMEIPVELGLASDDGRIDEQILGTSLVVTSATEASYSALQYAQFIDGSVDYSTFAPPGTWDGETAELAVEVRFETGSSSGTFLLRTHRETGGDTYDDPPLVASW